MGWGGASFERVMAWSHPNKKKRKRKKTPILIYCGLKVTSTLRKYLTCHLWLLNFYLSSLPFYINDSLVFSFVHHVFFTNNMSFLSVLNNSWCDSKFGLKQLLIIEGDQWQYQVCLCMQWFYMDDQRSFSEMAHHMLAN